MSHFKAKMHQIRFWLGRRPQIPQVALYSGLHPHPQLDLRGPTSSSQVATANCPGVLASYTL